MKLDLSNMKSSKNIVAIFWQIIAGPGIKVPKENKANYFQLSFVRFSEQLSTTFCELIVNQGGTSVPNDDKINTEAAAHLGAGSGVHTRLTGNRVIIAIPHDRCPIREADFLSALSA